MEIATEEDVQVTTILLTGVNGQLGSAIRRRWSQEEYQSRFCVIASHHDILDISNKEAVDAALEQFCPDVVVNCAGFNVPCFSQKDRELCWLANAMGTKNLAEACVRRGAAFLHVSCDSVFGADDCRYSVLSDINRLHGLGFCVDDLDCRYTENSLCGPIDFCGACKLAAENAIIQLAASSPGFRYWILRTGSVFEYPWRVAKNFLYSLASIIKGHKKEVPVPADVLFSLCYAPEAARAISWFLESWEASREVGGGLITPGIYHLSNEGSSSWYQVAIHMSASFGSDLNRIKPVSSVDYKKHHFGDMPPLENWGRYRVLSTDKYNALGGPKFSHWKDSLDSWCTAFGGALAAVV